MSAYRSRDGVFEYLVMYVLIFVGLGIAFVLADCSMGSKSGVYPGVIVGKTHRPAYTTSHVRTDDKGRVHIDTDHHPETFSIEVEVPDGHTSFTVSASQFAAAKERQIVTCYKRFGRWTEHSYGWRLSSLSAPPAIRPERPSHDPDPRRHRAGIYQR